MISFARTLRIDRPVARVWANLADLPGFAQGMPALSEVRGDQHAIDGRVTVGLGPFGFGGQLDLEVVERQEPRLLRLRGEVAIDTPGGRAGGDTARFDASWFLEPDETGGTQVRYVMRLRASPTLETLASMTLSRKAAGLDRRVQALLARSEARRRAA